MSSFPEDEFKPSKYITREEIAGILAETAHYKNIPITDDNIGLIWGKDDERRDSEKRSTKRQVEKIIKDFIEILNYGENAD